MLATAAAQPMRLTPRQNQDFRLLLRVCQRSLVAIEGYGNPWITQLLPLCATWPSLLDALLSVAAQARPTREKRDHHHLQIPTARAAAAAGDALSPASASYHEALTYIQELLSDQVISGMHGIDGILAALSGALILMVMSFSEPAADWWHHAQQITQLVDSCPLSQFATHSPLSQLLLTMAAQLDVGCLFLGLDHVSTSAWSRYKIDNLPRDGSKPFLDFEVISGWPVSFVSLVSRLSEAADRRRRPGASAATSQRQDHTERVFLQTMLDLWEPPEIPETLSSSQRLVLSTAWRSMHRAAKLFHRRGLGFHSDLTKPTVGLTEDVYVSAVQDLVVGVRYLLDSFRQHGFCIANSMAWTMAVMASECGSSMTCHLQAEVRQIIRECADTFLLSHLNHLLKATEDLWSRQAASETCQEDVPLSLESVVKDNGLCIALL